MKYFQFIAPAFLGVLLLLLSGGCSKSDDQQAFENQAYSPPDGYTAMSANAQQQDRVDPDDWRISPMYQGLIEVSTPAYPNPVALNNSFRIDIDILGYQSVPGLEIYVLNQTQNLVGPIAQYGQSSLNPGIKVLVLDPGTFSNIGTSQGAAGLNRLIIFDGRDNVITYGDIQVE